jgi:hypothetical protein
MAELRIAFRISVHAYCVIQESQQNLSLFPFYYILVHYLLPFISIENSTAINKPIKYVVYLDAAI